jgi:hypothetical protein
MSLTHSVHTPLPAPNDDARNTLKLIGEVWSLTNPTFALIYASDLSTNIVIQVVHFNAIKQEISCKWYLQPNLHIRESLAHAFNVKEEDITVDEILVMKEFSTDCILNNEPLFKSERFLNFTWNCYNILNYVVQVIVTVG